MKKCKHEKKEPVLIVEDEPRLEFRCLNCGFTFRTGGIFMGLGFL